MAVAFEETTSRELQYSVLLMRKLLWVAIVLTTPAVATTWRGSAQTPAAARRARPSSPRPTRQQEPKSWLYSGSEYRSQISA